MRRWLDGDAAKRACPADRIGEALGYLRNQWSALTVYLGDPRIPIDNGQSEQIIRPLTVGRNNWQFLGHPKAAAGRLQLYSVVSSAHRHHLMIDDYLEDVLRKLADAQQNHPADLELGSPYLADLLPDRWAFAQSQSVHEGSRRRSGNRLRGEASAACKGPDAGPCRERRPSSRCRPTHALVLSAPLVAVIREQCPTRALFQ